MFLQRLLESGNAPMLEQVAKFTQQRHRLLAENIVNVDTPNYIQRDLSVDKFQAMLRRRLEDRKSAPPGAVKFDDIPMESEKVVANILFHDGNNRSKEQLMSDLARNALMHNMAMELLRKQYNSLESALRERMT